MAPIDVKTISKESVDEFREQFFGQISENDDTFYKDDIADIKSNDYLVRFYITHSKRVISDAVTSCIQKLTWRKEYKVRDITEKDFPKEMLTSGAYYARGEDKNGCPIMWYVPNNVVRKSGEESLDLWNRFFVYNFEKLHQKRGDKRIVFILNLYNMGVTNMDTALLNWQVKCFQDYYPDATAVWKIVQLWLSEEAKSRVKFATRKDVFEYIDRSNWPKSLGGEDDYVFEYSPSQ